MMNKKKEFEVLYEHSKQLFGEITKMVVAIKLPTGAVELIINTDNIESKYGYYLDAYDDDMKLKNNSEVEIVGVLFV